MINRDKNKNARKILAYCGLDCSACPAYLATKNDDDVLRAETAGKWSELYGAERKAGDINCDGCPGDSGRLFVFCGACEVRACVRQRKIATCASCPEYSCARLDAFCAVMPTARTLLEKFRQEM
jgi:hypothetical protein